MQMGIVLDYWCRHSKRQYRRGGRHGEVEALWADSSGLKVVAGWSLV